MNPKIIALVLLILIGIYVLSDSLYIVREYQQVIVTQLGKPVGEPSKDAGLYVKLPFIQKARYFDKRVLSWDGEPNEVPTSDKTFIWVDTSARWVIVDPLKFLERMNTEGRALDVMNNLINGLVRDLVTKNDLIEIILSSDWKEEYASNTERVQELNRQVKVGRDRYSQIILNNAKEVTREYGIELLDVFIKRINYTEQVRNRVYDRMISERQRIAAEKRSEGEGEKLTILGTLQKELLEIESEAFRTAQEIRGKADAEAAKIYGEAYSVDRDFYAFYETLLTYRDVVGKNTKLVLDSNSDLYKYLNSVK